MAWAAATIQCLIKNNKSIMKQLSFEAFFAQRNPKYTFLLNRMQSALGVAEVTYDDISVANMTTVKDYLLNVEGNSGTSVKAYMSIISSTCNVLACDGLIRPVNFKLIGRIKPDKCENVALTEDEVQLFVDYYNRIYDEPCHQTTKDVLTLFLIEMFTGARCCDCERFKREDIEDGVLTYISQKTHTLTRVPVHKMLPLLLQRMPQREICRATKSRVIKRTAERLGINQMEQRNYRGVLKFRPRYEYLSTHTARRTFVTLLVDKNVPIATVGQMCGHASVNMTYRYYRPENIDIGKEAMSFFQ